MTLAFFTSIVRPRSVGAWTRTSVGIVSTSVFTTWLPMMFFSRSNQNAEISVRSAPLSGMPYLGALFSSLSRGGERMERRQCTTDVAEDDVVGRDAVRRDEEEMAGIGKRVDVADFAPGHELEPVQRTIDEGRRHFQKEERS
jgi:hypothetical protein